MISGKDIRVEKGDLYINGEKKELNGGGGSTEKEWKTVNTWNTAAISASTGFIDTTISEEYEELRFTATGGVTPPPLVVKSETLTAGTHASTAIFDSYTVSAILQKNPSNNNIRCTVRSYGTGAPGAYACKLEYR